MAGSAATSALFQVLFEKLASVAIEQFGRLLCVRRDLDKLKSTLTAINAVIQDAEQKAVKEGAVRDWVAKLRDVAYDADDLLDEFLTEFQRHKEEIQQDSVMFRKVRTFFSRSNSLAFRINMCFKLNSIAEKLAMVAEERSRYQLRDFHTLPQMATIEDRMTDAVIDETTVYGREDDLEKILKLLLEIETDRKDLSVVTIVGMGGMGKTTLAQLAFNHKRVVKRESFDSRIWVCVSDKFDITRIGRAMIEFVTKQKCDLSELACVVDSVRQILSGKKFLLVLDDVWKESQTEWEKLKKMLLGGAKGSKTIVTTRSDKVASIMGTNISPYRLGHLVKEDCWKLFEHRAFSTENTERDPSLEAIGREIVDKCGGSPLAAKALGSLMRFKRGIQEWKAVRDSNTWISTEEGDQVMASLRLSYNHLSPRLKQCFAYCSIFPKDTQIDRDDLILQWIAQGFIPSNANSHAVDVGNEYFNNLVMMSFLEKDSTISLWLRYKMHDLVHDLTQSVAGDEYFIRYADQKEPAPQRYRFCSLVGSLKASELEDFFHESRKTRALRLLNSEITDCIRLRHLRVLDIGRGSQIKELHGSINRLKHLRYLRILDNSDISELPNSIGGLLNLQVLNISRCDNLKSLPQSFTSLQKLVALELFGCFKLESLPEYVDSLQSLLTLSLRFCRSLVSLPESIGKLANLRTLQLSDCSSLISLPESLDSLQSLLTLSLGSCDSLVSLPESIGKLANLRTLQLSHCSSLLSLPQSLSNLSNLQELDLQWCDKIAELPEGMANMTSLRHLKNRDMWSLKGMPSGMGQLRSLVTLERFAVGEGSNHSSIAEMEHLNLIAGEMTLSHLENVKSPIDAAMANLKEKQNLRALFLNWSDSNHHSLIHHEEVLAELVPHPNIEKLDILGYPGMKLPDWLRTMGGSEPGLPNLVELTLHGLKCLPSLVGGLPPCIKKLRVGAADAMKNISTFPLLQLEELSLSGMPNLEEWSESELLYPRLVKLEISDCPKMHISSSCIPASVEELSIGESSEVMVDLPEAIRRFTSLRVLVIGSCRNLARLPEWLADLTSLEELRIVNSREMHISSSCIPASVEELPSPSSPPPLLLRLRKLTITKGSPDVWNGLLQYICSATLENLRIGYPSSDDTADLPEAIRRFTSLRVLHIFECQNLARLPQWLVDLTSLEELNIFKCSPSLRERCKKDTGEDWPKIAHIPKVLMR